MSPRRNVFGEDYIVETVKAYRKAAKKEDSASDLSWIHDVLDLYFSTVEKTNVVRHAESIFRDSPEIARSGSHPVEFSPHDVTKVPIQEFLRLTESRKSVRWYTEQEVPRELIDQAFKAALQAPSACNRQPFRFLIFDKKPDVQRVASLAPGTAGFDHNFPVIVVVIGRLRAYPDPRDRHLIYIDSSLAAMSFILALESQGLSSCIINWPDMAHTDKQSRETLTLARDEQITMLIALGYARQQQLIPYSGKMRVENIRTFNPAIS